MAALSLFGLVLRDDLLTTYKRFGSEERNADAIWATGIFKYYIEQYYSNA
jgi:hypothetical protein